MPALFCLALDPALRQVRARSPAGAEFLAYLDDIYIICNRDDVATIFDDVQLTLQNVCHIDVNLGKLAAWSKRANPSPPGLADRAENPWVHDPTTLGSHRPNYHYDMVVWGSATLSYSRLRRTGQTGQILCKVWYWGFRPLAEICYFTSPHWTTGARWYRVPNQIAFVRQKRQGDVVTMVIGQIGLYGQPSQSITPRRPHHHFPCRLGNGHMGGNSMRPLVYFGRNTVAYFAH